MGFGLSFLLEEEEEEEEEEGQREREREIFKKRREALSLELEFVVRKHELERSFDRITDMPLTVVNQSTMEKTLVVNESAMEESRSSRFECMGPSSMPHLGIWILLWSQWVPSIGR